MMAHRSREESRTQEILTLVRTARESAAGATSAEDAMFQVCSALTVSQYIDIAVVVLGTPDARGALDPASLELITVAPPPREPNVAAESLSRLLAGPLKPVIHDGVPVTVENTEDRVDLQSKNPGRNTIVAAPLQDGETTIGALIIQQDTGGFDRLFATMVATEVSADLASRLVTLRLETERTVLAESLALQRRAAEQLLASAPVGIIRTTRDGQLLYANPAFAWMLGFPNAGDLFSAPHDPIEQLRREMFRDTDIFSGLREDQPFTWCCVELSHRAGGEVLVSGTSVLLRGPDDRDPVILHYLQDITETERTNRALEEVERHLEQAVQAGRIGLWDWDLRTGTVSINGMWARLLGYDSEPGTIEIEDFEALVLPDALHDVWEAMNAYLDARVAEYAVEIPMRGRAGTVWVLATGETIRSDADGAPIRILGAHVDISHQRARESALSETVRQRNRLIREIEHRVGNSLATVVSLLRVHASMDDSAPLRAAFDQAALRVQAIASAVNLSHQGTPMEMVPLAALISAIIRDLDATNSQAPWFRISSSETEVYVNLDAAVPLALALNEILSGIVDGAALRQDTAAPATPAEVSITVSRSEALRITIDSDVAVDQDEHAAVRTMIRSAVTAQLGATLAQETRRDGGTRIVLDCPSAVTRMIDVIHEASRDDAGTGPAAPEEWPPV